MTICSVFQHMEYAILTFHFVAWISKHVFHECIEKMMVGWFCSDVEQLPDIFNVVRVAELDAGVGIPMKQPCFQGFYIIADHYLEWVADGFE